MADRPVLVTGASGGRQGNTGRHVSEMLLARSVPVRAFVHKIDERSDRLGVLGAEICEGGFLDINSVRRAAEGVSSIYFAYPVTDRSASQHLAAAQAHRITALRTRGPNCVTMMTLATARAQGAESVATS